MDPLAFAVVAVVAGVVAFLAGRAVERGRRLREVTALTADLVATDDPVSAVRRLRAQAEETAAALELARRELVHVAELTAVGVLLLGDDGRIAFANGSAHRSLDRVAGSLVGLTPIEAFVDRRIEAIVADAQAGGAGGGELRLGDADGGVLLVRARPSVARGIWIILEDVTELRRLQQIRAEFIDNLSHELRTPLTTVSLLAETLAREADEAGGALPGRMRDRIAKIEVETGHLVQMVNELLDLSRIEGGAALVLVDDVDLGALAGASVERLRLFAERQHVTLRLDVQDRVPPVRGDEARLGQVLVNLVHNAVKFSPAGGEVVVHVGRGGDEVVVSVEDHGVGIPKAAQARIFERFYKVDRARVRGGGTGLGLAIARHVIGQHGGRIWVESEEGKGSTFSFALPVRAIQTAEVG